MRNLEAQLLKYLNPALYGIGQAKSWESLLQEISSGECEIGYSSGKSIRIVRVLSIQVSDPAGKLLVEAYQEFADGRRRERNLKGVSEAKAQRKP